ncbi:MAG TPA: histidine phosphatase family protein [Acidimicrobiales bacterium]|nr:histidine phosphatase family protein [Acidimicrobiales bacterium]
MADVILVRHGATEWSASGRHTSVTDLPLTPAGEVGARAAGRWLAGRRVGAVLTSPRRRARETCALAGLGGPARVDDDLAEWRYGEYEGLTTARIREDRPGWSIWSDGAPGGESPEEVGRRADRVVGRVRDLLGRDGGDVALFSHGHFLRVLATRWVELEVAWGRALMLDAGAVCLLGFERETPALRLWNLRPTAPGGAGAPPGEEPGRRGPGGLGPEP